MIRTPPLPLALPARSLPGLALILALAGAVSVGQAALSAIVDQQDRTHGFAPFAARGSAPAPVERAAPAAGVTGTIALPAGIPVPAGLSLDGSVAAARPFSLGAASPLARGRALDCLATAVYYEAASEPDAGQQAVAQVILNRVRHPAFPNSVCGVVYQGSERAGCQFSFACDGAMARAPQSAAYARALRVAAMALAGRVYAPVGLATHYHTYAVTPAWNRSLVMTAAVGAHFFHRWSGAWGTLAAFRQHYAATEPMPGPHARVPEPLLAPVATAAATLATPWIAEAKTAPAPAVATDGIKWAATAIAKSEQGATAGQPESTILDRWKDSGQPIN